MIKFYFVTTLEYIHIRWHPIYPDILCSVILTVFSPHKCVDQQNTTNFKGTNDMFKKLKFPKSKKPRIMPKRIPYLVRSLLYLSFLWFLWILQIVVGIFFFFLMKKGYKMWCKRWKIRDKMCCETAPGSDKNSIFYLFRLA